MTPFNILLHQRRSDIEREKSDKLCSEALISALGYFTCRKSTTWDPRLYFPSEGSHTQDFYALKKSINPGRDRTHFRRKSYSVFLLSEKIHRRRPGSNPLPREVILRIFTLWENPSTPAGIEPANLGSAGSAPIPGLVSILTEAFLELSLNRNKNATGNLGHIRLAVDDVHNHS